MLWSLYRSSLGRCKVTLGYDGCVGCYVIVVLIDKILLSVMRIVVDTML